MANPQQPEHRKAADIPQTLLTVLFLSLMIIACLWILQPFILGFTWAATVVIATWPLMLWLQRLLWNRRSLAVLVMTLLLLLLLIIPVTLVVNSLLDTSEPLIAWLRSENMALPSFNWLNDIPLVGSYLYKGWHNILENGVSAFWVKIRPYIGSTTGWFIGQAAHIGRLLIHLALMLLFSMLLYWRGEQVADGVRRFALRLAASRGEAAILLATQAIRAVALGVVVTALLQAILGGIGLTVAGVPYAILFTLLILLSCLIQLGPLPILIPAVIWLYWMGDNTWGTILLVWSGVVSVIDTVIRPLLIRIGARLPLILILTGVIGGLIAFGLIGLFIGPTLLAVCWRLYSVWLTDENDTIQP